MFRSSLRNKFHTPILHLDQSIRFFESSYEVVVEFSPLCHPSWCSRRILHPSDRVIFRTILSISICLDLLGPFFPTCPILKNFPLECVDIRQLSSQRDQFIQFDIGDIFSSIPLQHFFHRARPSQRFAHRRPHDLISALAPIPGSLLALRSWSYIRFL